ncbi:thioesterase domain-containing protein [Bordetella sp. N]|uniref:thioesterase domain-containing protein n=1 Tax=Bordetella sp. N TaxID=1746199 RepID=UPI0009E763E0|nr:thioesterase domain-containing protein [Bordetella sp. N]
MPCRQWRAGPLGHIRLDNLYGPTETTVACMYRQTTEEDCEQAIVGIGEAYPSRSVYVLDAQGNEAPIGGLGELCIGGDTLARGYLGRAALTAEKFVPDPYRDDGARLYRSGDLCRRREDGSIDFLGRLDQQVKLRGFRIELGEIEAVLRQVQGVDAAVVALRVDVAPAEGQSSTRQTAGATSHGAASTADKQRRLVAYITGTADEAALRQAIAAKLPAHMAPAAYVRLDRLPLMPNGKVDRAALPAPAPAAKETAHTAPGTHFEARLLAIWREVLGREDIGVTDDFFEAGGDSISALRSVELARARGLPAISLGALFGTPTVRAIAAVSHDTAGHAGDTLPSNIMPLGAQAERERPEILFAFHPGYGLVAEYRQLARHLDGVLALYGVQSPVHSEPAWWPGSLAELASDYAERIRRVQPKGPYRLLGWSIGGEIAARVAQVLEAQGHHVALLALLDSYPRGMAREEGGGQAIVPTRDRDGRAHFTDAQVDTFVARWRAETGDGAWHYTDPLQARGFARKALLARASYEGLDGWNQPMRLRVTPTLWLAAGSLALSAQEVARGWSDVAGTTVVLAGVLDTDHAGIVHHPDVLDAVTAAAARDAIAPARLNPDKQEHSHE